VFGVGAEPSEHRTPNTQHRTPNTEHRTPNTPFAAAFADACSRGASPLDAMQFCDTQTMLRDDLLHKCDRVSMAVGLEARVPFLDHCLVEWAFSLPESMRVNGRTLKYLLKRWLSRHLPPELIYRRKQGFEVPVYDWLTGPLRGWMRELLLSPGALGEEWFQPAGVRKLIERLEAGERTLALPVYSLIAWELWRQQFLSPLSSDLLPPLNPQPSTLNPQHAQPRSQLR
jgi:asparagine synthase (glutamine-hydrolysing)